MNPASLRIRAMELRKQADELDRLAEATENSPNLPTIEAKQILARAGFRVIHADTLCNVKCLVEWAKGQMPKDFEKSVTSLDGLASALEKS